MTETLFKKPLIIILEGPTGVGKTTLSHYLRNKLVGLGYQVYHVPEFSDQITGHYLREKAKYGKNKPFWLESFSGLLMFLSDKVYSFEMAETKNNCIWIADRFITTQLIVGLRTIENNQQKVIIKKIIQDISSMVMQFFSENSLFVLLRATPEELETRLQERLETVLTEKQLRDLAYEVEKYSNLDTSAYPCKTLQILNTISIESAGELILNQLPIQRSQR